MTAPSVELGTIASVERKSVKPDEIRGHASYVGLENITGDGTFVEVAPACETDIKSNKFVFSSEHILYGKLRPYLSKIAAPQFGGVCSTDIVPIRPGPDIDRRYLLHVLRTPVMVGHATRLAVGANLPRLSPKSLETFPIPLPPIEEQRRIAAILDAADELRVKRRHGLRLVRDLENSMFADFVESHASVATAPLAEVAERVTVGHVGPTSEHFVEDGVPFIRTGNIGDGTITRDELRYVDPSFHATLAKSTLREGDLLISRVISDEIRAAVVPRDLDGANCANAIIVRPGQRTSATFLLGLLRLARSQTSLLGRRVGSAQSVVNTKVVKEWQVPVPSRSALEALDHSFHRLRSLQALHHESLESLTTFFASLQQRAFRGEL